MAEDARPIIRDVMIATVRSRLNRIIFGRFHSLSSSENSTVFTELLISIIPSLLRSFSPR